MVTTLFMLMSLDGKISSGSNNERDFDKDLPLLPQLASGLEQYYKLEQETDNFSFNTGRVMAKVGWNELKPEIERLPVTFVIVDNKPHLTEQGVRNLLQRSDRLYVATTFKEHPAYMVVDDERLTVLALDNATDMHGLFQRLTLDGIDKMTIQSGGEMNALLLRSGLIDQVSVVIAPALIGGRNTPTLIDGESLQTLGDIAKMRTLRLEYIKDLQDSYIHVKYSVLN